MKKWRNKPNTEKMWWNRKKGLVLDMGLPLDGTTTGENTRDGCCLVLFVGVLVFFSWGCETYWVWYARGARARGARARRDNMTPHQRNGYVRNMQQNTRPKHSECRTPGQQNTRNKICTLRAEVRGGKEARRHFASWSGYCTAVFDLIHTWSVHVRCIVACLCVLLWVHYTENN